MKWFRRILLVLLVAMVASQFVRPARTNPPVDPSQTMTEAMQIPPQVSSILNRSCRDCHSNETVWPWYSEVAPISWLLVNDVREGRDELSFSEWGSYPTKKAAHKLEELCEMVEREEMPPAIYVIPHPDARLSPADRQNLCSWANAERARLLATLPPGEALRNQGERKR